MNWIEIVVAIKSKLIENEHKDLADKITEAQLVLGTSGEMFLNVIEALNEIRANNTEQFSLIQNYYDILIKYAKDIGYY